MSVRLLDRQAAPATPKTLVEFALRVGRAVRIATDLTAEGIATVPAGIAIVPARIARSNSVRDIVAAGDESND